MDCRAAQRLLAIRSLLSCVEEDGYAAGKAIVCLLKMLRVSRTEQVLIADLVRMSGLRLASRTLEHVLEWGEVSEPLLKEIQTLYAQEMPAIQLRNTLVAERVFSLVLYQNIIGSTRGYEPVPVNQGQEANFPVLPDVGFCQRPWFRAMVVSYLRNVARLIAALEKPFPQALTRAEQICEKWAKEKFVPLSSILAQAMERFFEHAATCEAEARSAIVGIAVKRYLTAQGTLPASLAELVPTYLSEVPLDPFTGDSLLYRREGRGFVIYSVGQNRMDDGGDLTLTPGPEPSADAGFAVDR